MKEEKKNLVEMVEEYQNGIIVSRKINGKSVVIPEMERNFVKFKKMSFNKFKNAFGEYKTRLSPTSKNY